MTNDINKSITEYQDKCNSTVFLLSLIEPVLRTFDNKKITKRIQTAVKGVLPEHTVSYGKSYSWYEMSIWGNGITYDQRISLNLGYFNADDGYFNIDQYIKDNQRHYLDRERYDTLEGWKGEKIDTLVKEHKDLLDQITAFKKKYSDVPWPINQFIKFSV